MDLDVANLAGTVVIGKHVTMKMAPVYLDVIQDSLETCVKQVCSSFLITNRKEFIISLNLFKL